MHSPLASAENVLHRATTPRGGGGDDGTLPAALREIMELVRTELQMEAAFIAELSGGRRIIRVLDGDGSSFGLAVNQEADADDTLCGRLLEGEVPGVIPDAEALGLGGGPDLGAWVGMPVRRPDGSVYGTLCCLSHRADPALARRDLSVMRLLARLAGSRLDGPIETPDPHDGTRARIRAAIEDPDMLRMVVQPVVSLAGGATVGFEALARFVAEPVQSPEAWFAEAATVGLGVDLEMAAVRAAIGLLDGIPDHLFLSVNASPRCLGARSLRREIADAAEGNLVLELTERDPVEDYDTLVGALDELRAEGVRLAIDDVGAGFSSMRHVLQLEPDMMKLDVSLAHGIELDPRRRALVAAIRTFADSSRIDLVAEGIETSRQMETLREIGVSFGQGYYIARPDAPARHLENAWRRGGFIGRRR
jgi:EAL domain-containing protein (putative c-di-GMP-specific phosphodiesterase class I)